MKTLEENLEKVDCKKTKAIHLMGRLTAWRKEIKTGRKEVGRSVIHTARPQTREISKFYPVPRIFISCPFQTIWISIMRLYIVLDYKRAE